MSCRAKEGRPGGDDTPSGGMLSGVVYRLPGEGSGDDRYQVDLARVVNSTSGTEKNRVRGLDAIEGKHSVLSFDEAKVLATKLLGEPEFYIDGQVVRSGGVVDQVEENASKIDTLYQSHQNGRIRAKLSAPTVALTTCTVSLPSSWLSAKPCHRPHRATEPHRFGSA